MLLKIFQLLLWIRACMTGGWAGPERKPRKKKE